MKRPDDRPALLRAMGAKPGDAKARAAADGFLRALLSTVASRRRTVLARFGAFEWVEWRNRLPTGRFVRTWRLTFKPCRRAKGKYKGARK